MILEWPFLRVVTVKAWIPVGRCVAYKNLRFEKDFANGVLECFIFPLCSTPLRSFFISDPFSIYLQVYAFFLDTLWDHDSSDWFCHFFHYSMFWNCLHPIVKTFISLFRQEEEEGWKMSESKFTTSIREGTHTYESAYLLASHIVFLKAWYQFIKMEALKTWNFRQKSQRNNVNQSQRAGLIR